MQKPIDVPLSEVHTVYVQLRSKKGQYFLTNAGCLFLEKGVYYTDRDKDFLFQVPADAMLITRDFRLMYRVDHYPVMIGENNEVLDIPIEVVHKPIVLYPRDYEWGIGNCKLVDLDERLRDNPDLSHLLLRRQGPSSGPF